mmetsp:Transcript_39588/g.86449  ORF Transcript_39588/g.86449 Transcript_39588/m.86449 type:complete len:201 (-) Transcript_39588:394-996(-)
MGSFWTLHTRDHAELDLVTWHRIDTGRAKDSAAQQEDVFAIDRLGLRAADVTPSLLIAEGLDGAVVDLAGVELIAHVVLGGCPPAHVIGYAVATWAVATRAVPAGASKGPTAIAIAEASCWSSHNSDVRSLRPLHTLRHGEVHLCADRDVTAWHLTLHEEDVFPVEQLRLLAGNVPPARLHPKRLYHPDVAAIASGTAGA